MLSTGAAVCNDNSYARRLFYKRADEHGPMTRLLAHVPTARKLIKRYIKEAWKHSPEHSEYAFREYQLCSLLERTVVLPAQRHSQMNDVAWVLQVSPVMLMNDTDLPF